MLQFGQNMMSRAIFQHKRIETEGPALSTLAIYDPSDLSTLFQDAAMTIPVSTHGDPVGAVLDQSGNGYHLTQNAANKRPLYKTTDGLHWLEFDGVNDFMEVEFSAPLLAAGVAMACRITSTSHHNDSTYHLSNNADGTYYDFYSRAETATEFHNQFRRSGFAVGVESTDGTDYVGEDHIYTDILSIDGKSNA